MNREIISAALSGISDRHVNATAVFSPRASQKSPERTKPMHVAVKKRASRRMITIALAAALLLSLAIAAYATDLFGLRAILIKDDNLTAYKWVDNGDGTRRPVENPDGGFVSITQPQDVPDEMSADIREKIENSEKAWAEWKAWNDGNKPKMPEVYKAPDGCMLQDETDNGDGTWTINFYGSVIPGSDTSQNPDDVKSRELLETRIATAEERQQMQDYITVSGMGYPGYDYKYNVIDENGAAKLEDIAAKYGLRLRRKSTALYQNFGDFTEFLSREELTQKINEIAGGNHSFFRTEPTGYDKFYYWDEGTFAVSFYTTDDMSNMGTSCYLYNSPYGTLSSGYEIISEVSDVNAFSPRIHTTPDGTDVTVLHNGADMFAYVYLDNSFVNMQIFQPEGLSDEEIDSIIDMVDFSVIS